MKICLVAPEPSEWGAVSHSVPALAELLAERHEVTLIRSGEGAVASGLAGGYREVVAEPGEDLASVRFCCAAHRDSAAVMAAIRASYGEEGPDYLEVPDFAASGLVPLQARLGGDPVLRDTLIAVRISPSGELACLHEGALGQPGMQRPADLERLQLSLADRLLWPGGDCLDLYRRYYAEAPLPQAVELAAPVAFPSVDLGRREEERDASAPLRILYAGELRYREGVFDLVEACLGLADDAWELTLFGADRETAWMGEAVGLTIEAMSGEDPRIRFEEPGAPDRLASRFGAHDLLVVPARLSVCADAAVAAMRAGLPVLVTPVGNLAEAVVDGVSGWHASGLGSAPLGEALARLLADRDELERVRRSGAVAARGAALADPGPVAAGYERLLAEAAAGADAGAAAASAAGAGEPLVTAIVPYFHAAEYVGEAVASLLGQSHRNLEVLIVNDGSFGPEDSVLDELAADPRVRVLTKVNGGDASARNLGAIVARGEYLMMLDADNVLEPTFVERALATHRRQPGLAYVGCWLRFIGADGAELPDPYSVAPVGNGGLSEDEENWDGDTLALLRRSLFADEGYRYGEAMFCDWQLYRRLRRDGRLGAIIPERLARYRVLPDSVMRAHAKQLHDRDWAAGRDWNRLRGVRWTAEA